jgi:hypothetical protein
MPIDAFYITHRRLNCLYKRRWNGALHCGHDLLLATIKVIRHCKWYLCWQVPKIHAPSSPNGEQQIKHNSPFCGKGSSVGHKSSPIFSNMVVTYSQSNSRCVAQFIFAFFCIFGKLLGNILDILGHDVKSCDRNLPSSHYSTYIFTSSTSICVVQDVAKIHARCMWFEICLVTFTNVSTSFWYYSCMSINVWW